jgi:hypothetical protein
MKHLKKFENFYLSPDVDSDEQEWQDYSKEIRTGSKISDRDQDEQEISIDRFSDRGQDDEFTDEMSPEIIVHDEFTDEMSDETDEFSGGHIMRFDNLLGEAKKEKTYKKSGLKNPKKADFDKNKKISEYEGKRGKAIEDSIDKKGGKGLTAEQKEKLSPSLQKAILAKKKKK